MEEIVKETETVETEVVKDEFAEEIDAKTAERLRKFHEKEEAERIKEELKDPNRIFSFGKHTKASINQ